MAFDKPILQRSNPYKQTGTNITYSRTIYYGEVMSIEDDTDGGKIKVKIPDLDNRTSDINELPWCYPLEPKFLHIYPQVGEMVRVFIEDIKYPERSRFWMGNVVSQLHKIGFDSKFTALSTTNMGLTRPEKAVSTYPDAKGVFPEKTDIALIGRVNTDIILRVNEVHIRAGKHENDNPLKLNTKNPAEISLVYNQDKSTGSYNSNIISTGDKIALISHSGEPQFKGARLTQEDRDRIFAEGHPMVRGDVALEIITILRNAIIGHIHGYSNLAADKNEIINQLESINLEGMLQKNIVIN